MTPGEGAIFDPRGMIGRIYEELNMTLLYITYSIQPLCRAVAEKIFSCISIISLW